MAADYTINLRRYNGLDWDTLHPATTIAQVYALQTALNAKENVALKGAANGYCPLDASSLIPLANIPQVIKDGLNRIGSITLTGSAAVFDDILTANTSMAHGTAVQGDFWSVAHATANAVVTITESTTTDDIFQDVTTGAYTSTSMIVNPGDWIIFEGYNTVAANKYAWSIQNNNSANVYSVIGHTHGSTEVVASTLGVVVVSNATTGTLYGSDITIAELGYLDGVTTNIQTQLNGKSPTAGSSSITTLGTITTGIWNGTAVPVLHGGTGATTAAGALTNLGLTATAAELNALDGITATVTELNYTDGVTSAIQTQLNGKSPTAGSTSITTLGTIATGVWNGTTIAIANGGTGATTAANALIALGLTATAAELNALDGITSTVTELNYTDGVTSNIQTQLNAKSALAGSSSIVTVGTITSGVWNGTDIAVADGGTGASTAATARTNLGLTYFVYADTVPAGTTSGDICFEY